MIDILWREFDGVNLINHVRPWLMNGPTAVSKIDLGLLPNSWANQGPTSP